MNTHRSVSRGIVIIVATSVFLAFTYNVFSSKSISLVRKEVNKVAVDDSMLFNSHPAPDSSKRQIDHSDIKVIAPEHERALRNPDSMAAVVSKERKQEVKNDVVRIITLEQFKRLLAQAKPVVFDARDAEAYRKGHVKGSRNLYGLEADQHFEQLVTIPRDSLILLYCNNPECHLGRMAAEFLGTIGFTNFYLYDDGWDGWMKAKMPIDSTITEW